MRINHRIRTLFCTIAVMAVALLLMSQTPACKDMAANTSWICGIMHNLGLAYCYETAQKLGGELRLDRTSELGTSFTLSLPIQLNT